MEGKGKKTALLQAGYSPHSARNVERGGEVQSLLLNARSELSDITTIKRIDVINVIFEAIDMARTLADPSQMINGADKLAKIMGYYAPESIKVDITVNNNTLATKIRGMTDEELYNLARANAANNATVVEGEVINDE